MVLERCQGQERLGISLEQIQPLDSVHACWAIVNGTILCLLRWQYYPAAGPSAGPGRSGDADQCGVPTSSGGVASDHEDCSVTGPGMVGDHRRKQSCRVLLIDETLDPPHGHRYVTVILNGDDRRDVGHDRRTLQSSLW